MSSGVTGVEVSSGFMSTPSQAFGQDVTLRMCECRKRVDQASLHKFLDQGMIAGQLLEFARSIEVGATIAQVCDVSNLR